MTREHKTTFVAVDRFLAVDRIHQRPKNQENRGKRVEQATCFGTKRFLHPRQGNTLSFFSIKWPMILHPQNLLGELLNTSFTMHKIVPNPIYLTNSHFLSKPAQNLEATQKILRVQTIVAFPVQYRSRFMWTFNPNRQYIAGESDDKPEPSKRPAIDFDIDKPHQKKTKFLKFLWLHTISRWT